MPFYLWNLVIRYSALPDMLPSRRSSKQASVAAAPNGVREQVLQCEGRDFGVFPSQRVVESRLPTGTQKGMYRYEQ